MVSVTMLMIALALTILVTFAMDQAWFLIVAVITSHLEIATAEVISLTRLGYAEELVQLTSIQMESVTMLIPASVHTMPAAFATDRVRFLSADA